MAGTSAAPARLPERAPHAPKEGVWYPIQLGPSMLAPPAAEKEDIRGELRPQYYTLRYEFKPASIDVTRPGVLRRSSGSKVRLELPNNQAGRPKLEAEGFDEPCKDLDALLFFDGQTMRLERLHHSLRSIKFTRVGVGGSLSSRDAGPPAPRALLDRVPPSGAPPLPVHLHGHDQLGLRDQPAASPRSSPLAPTASLRAASPLAGLGGDGCGSISATSRNAAECLLDGANPQRDTSEAAGSGGRSPSADALPATSTASGKDKDARKQLKKFPQGSGAGPSRRADLAPDASETRRLAEAPASQGIKRKGGPSEARKQGGREEAGAAEMPDVGGAPRSGSGAPAQHQPLRDAAAESGRVISVHVDATGAGVEHIEVDAEEEGVEVVGEEEASVGGEKEVGEGEEEVEEEEVVYEEIVEEIVEEVDAVDIGGCVGTGMAGSELGEAAAVATDGAAGVLGKLGTGTVASHKQQVGGNGATGGEQENSEDSGSSHSGSGSDGSDDSSADSGSDEDDDDEESAFSDDDDI